MTLNHILTTPALIARGAARYGTRIAIETAQGNLSYAQLDAARIEAARALMSCGIQPGERIAIWAPNIAEWIVAALAIHSAGAALVPINTRMKGLEAAAILEDSGARLLFCCGTFLGDSYPAMLAAHRPATLERIVVFDGPSTEAETRTGTEAAGGCDETWDAFLLRAAGTPMEVFRAREAAVRPDTLMDIMFTSGTTGRPKGVMTTHGQNLRVVHDWAQIATLRESDRYLIVNPFFHAFGYKAGWLAAFASGATVLPHLVFNPERVLERIVRDRVSVLPGPPTLYHALLDMPGLAMRDLSSLRVAVTGAAAIAPSLIERMRAQLGFETVLTGYGLTESCGFAALCRSGDDAETVAHTSGRAMPGVEIRIADSSGAAVATGETGEVLIRGYNVMQGYFGQQDATIDTVDDEGWLHTGDLGTLDERGYLRITDRIKDMFIVGGFNCYPAEIERLFSAHPAVAQVALVGVPDERLGEVGHAYVVLRSGEHASPEELTDWARKNMANYKVPRHLSLVDQLPVSAAGKVLKYRLREAVENGAGSSAENHEKTAENTAAS
ncbi:FadD3 family acyl-CoA ligase [Paraburkholderia haematera]|uniref:3-[(3aS,4S,7aS)-7a-methyl-1, 5-dioxo-octahydro-1H-inden-4-yl]propanoyl:CoA ligase n=1 Tax=Paraburkholderia haematera TaxID=2793077 RepID=A0ABN7L7V7_9BURK|nr:FadD3 family acyl-CoA ligase [Paraburkholderia haematera]CAE6735567.1 3-[(3aS,4S,7aS)-7a-methyl-1, 5-dioxo-octahydro-1H-inden-4-yl]propanoyl:CoA ligase [Paraburkholderia haematera]